jgi:hypothetical protein
MSRIIKKNWFSNKHWVIIVIITISSYSLYTGYKNHKLNSKWETGDFDALVEKCMKDSGNKATLYPELTREYCECSINKIQSSIKRGEYAKTIKQSIEKQNDILGPIIKDCLTVYKTKINNNAPSN